MLPVSPTALTQAPRRSRIASIIALSVLIALPVAFAPAQPAQAASGGVSLAAGVSKWVTASSKRTSPRASVAVTVPSAVPLEVGLQLRAGSHASGYRAVVAVAADGAVTGGFRRVASNAETELGAMTALGIAAKPGEVVQIDAAVVGGSPVRLYLRAWRDGTIAPPNWQLAASDSSGSRYRKAGKVYLWARAGSGTQAESLRYRSLSVASSSAAKASAIGVLAPEPNPDSFSIAVLPDTQEETNSTTNAPFLNRVNWLVANVGRFDLRYVLHTGDLTNWGWLDPAQLTRAKAAMGVLGADGLPYAITIGNHDTAAVGWNGVRGSTSYGGAAYMYNPECPSRLGAANCNSTLLVRHTEAFNAAFPLAGMGNVGGAYEAGKADNYWTSFTANGTTWLVLTLELWPRAGAVDWAANVVASHPDANVIVQTHSYLTNKGSILNNAGGYGSTSPTYLYTQLISKYPNVKLVFSGHTGGFRNRVDTPHGHTVVSYLGNKLGSGSNPVRIVTVNTKTGQVISAVYDPLHRRTANPTSNRISVIR